MGAAGHRSPGWGVMSTTGRQEASDAAKVGGAVVATAVGTFVPVAIGGGVAATGAIGAATATTATLLGAAGASALVPVAGWIAAGVLTLAAGATVLVPALIKSGKNQKAAVAAAEAVGIPNAEEAPAIVTKALQNDHTWRVKEMQKLAKQLAKPAGVFGFISRGFKDLQKTQAQYALVAAVDQYEAMATYQGQPTPPAVVQSMVRTYGTVTPSTPSSTAWLVAGGASAALLGAAYYARRNS